jgi:hypothetical protein
MRTLWTLVALAVATPVMAQTPSIPDTYQIRYYADGATAPLTVSDTFLLTAATCNLTSQPTGSTVNPTRVSWADPVNAGRFCVFTFPATASLLAIPVGDYQGSLVAILSTLPAGQNASPESARATFSRQTAPSAPTGFRFVR